MNPLVSPPNRIRSLRERNWKFARYYDRSGTAADEFEMYDLINDPLEQQNLAHPQHPRYHDPVIISERIRLQQKLADLETEKLAPFSTPVNYSQRDNMPNAGIVLQAHPNHFNAATTIYYQLPQAASVMLRVYDSNGRQVDELVNAFQSPGPYSVMWNAQAHASGIYFYHLTAGSIKAIRSMSLVK